MKMNRKFARGRPNEGKNTCPNYQLDKIIGKRKLNGELKLKKLLKRHRDMIGLHLVGLSNRDIAFVTGYDEMVVGRVLRDPLSQAYIQSHHKGVEVELEGLHADAVSAIRQGLQDGDTNQKLKAADQFFKVSRRYASKSDEGKRTAEDVIALAMQAMASQGHALQSLAERREAALSRIIDAPYETVEDEKNGDDHSNVGEAGPRGIRHFVAGNSDG